MYKNNIINNYAITYVINTYAYITNDAYISVNNLMLYNLCLFIRFINVYANIVP